MPRWTVRTQGQELEPAFHEIVAKLAATLLCRNGEGNLASAAGDRDLGRQLLVAPSRPRDGVPLLLRAEMPLASCATA